MSELHKFIFDGLPVRGMLVRLTDSWQEILKRRQAAGGYPIEVMHLLGEMTAAGALMQGNIKFNGALVLQIFGDGPVKLAVAEVQPDLTLRATATVTGTVDAGSSLSQLVNLHNEGRCAITLDPKDKLPGQQAYQGVVPLFGDAHEKIENLAEVLEHYMLQSEQLDTKLILAADGNIAAGLLIQRLPVKGQGNLEGNNWGQSPNSPARSRTNDAAQSAAAKLESDPNYFEDQIGKNEDYKRIAMLASTLKREELLTLDADTILRRLFWEEPITRFEVLAPSFGCSCSRERVANMLRSLGVAEIDSVIAEQGQVGVTCEFCGAPYNFDPVDAAQIFTLPDRQQPPTVTVQ